MKKGGKADKRHKKMERNSNVCEGSQLACVIQRSFSSLQKILQTDKVSNPLPDQKKSTFCQLKGPCQQPDRGPPSHSAQVYLPQHREEHRAA